MKLGERIRGLAASVTGLGLPDANKEHQLREGYDHSGAKINDDPNFWSHMTVEDKHELKQITTNLKKL